MGFQASLLYNCFNYQFSLRKEGVGWIELQNRVLERYKERSCVPRMRGPITELDDATKRPVMYFLPE